MDRSAINCFATAPGLLALGLAALSLPAAASAQATSAPSGLDGPVAASSRVAFSAPRDETAFTPSYAPIAIEPETAFGPAVDFRDDARAVRRFDSPDRQGSVAVVQRRDIWREHGAVSDRLRLTTRGDLRRADGAPIPPTVRDAAGLEVDSYDVSYTRGWEAARTTTRSGLAVSLTPHAGLGVGDSGGTAEAGATLKIGPDSVAPNGAERFGNARAGTSMRRGRAAPSDTISPAPATATTPARA